LAQIALILSLTTENTHSTLRVPSGQALLPSTPLGVNRAGRGHREDHPQMDPSTLLRASTDSRGFWPPSAGRTDRQSRTMLDGMATTANESNTTKTPRHEGNGELKSCVWLLVPGGPQCHSEPRFATPRSGVSGAAHAAKHRGEESAVSGPDRRRICFSRQRYKQTLRGVYPERSRRALSDKSRAGRFRRLPVPGGPQCHSDLS